MAKSFSNPPVPLARFGRLGMEVHYFLHRLNVLRLELSIFPSTCRLARQANLPFQAGQAGISKEFIAQSQGVKYVFESYGKSQDPASKIVLVSVFAGEEYRRRLDTCLQSRRRYCQKNGYDFALMIDPPVGFDRPASWLRIPFLYRLMQDGCPGKIFFLDADALITNHSIRLEPFFEEMREGNVGKSFYFAEDAVRNLNAGSFFVRASAAAQSILDLIWNLKIYINHPQWENAAIINLYRLQPLVRRLIKVTKDCRKFNSYPKDHPNHLLYWTTWEPNDFILHFAALKGIELQQAVESHRAFAGLE